MSGLFAAPPLYPPSPPPPHPLGTCMWGGRTFNIWPLSQPLNDFAGVYIYTRLINNLHYAVYVGQSDGVGRRIREHQRDDPQIALSSHHLHCLTVNDGEQIRTQIERSLITTCNPPLNAAHRTGPAAWKIASVVPDRWSPGLGSFLFR